MEENCINNPKQHWFWSKYYGKHDYKPINAWKFMSCIDDFRVRFECSRCGAQHERSFVSWSEMLHLGYTNEQIKAIQ